MYRKIVLTSLFLLSLASVIAQNKEEKKMIIAQIEANDKLLEEYFETSLVDSIAGMFSPNCHFAMEYGAIMESREKVQEYLKKQLKSGKKISGYKLNPDEIKVYDDIVLEVGTTSIEYSMLPDKKLLVNKLNYMFVWKKSKEGRYHLRAAIWNPIENPCK